MYTLRQVRSRSRLNTRPRARGQFELLEERALLATVPFGALTNDTAEYMLGDVHVSVVLLESSPSAPNHSEDWNASTIASTKAKVTAGLNWWVDTLHRYYDDAYLNFDIDFTFADNPFVVNYEPITQTSGGHVNWVREFVTQQGYWIDGDINKSIYAFNHAQRVTHNANWSFTIFIVNDTNDADGKFATGGFEQAFAYGGGRFVVSPAGRPASTIAHEVGHVFWADDEYSTGDSYYDQRGYYNQQNTNGLNGAPDGFVQANSIMASGGYLTSSFNTHELPASTRAMIGWRDSDSDGIIDVLDVPLTLTGDGYRTAQGTYRFVGKSQAQTLPNLNSQSPTRSDITINKVRVAEYRIDGGSWLTAATYDTYTADLDLTIPLPAGEHSIEIRTRDTTTGVTSALFVASTSHPTSLTSSGISGFIFNDVNGNGAWDSSEGAISGRAVQLVTQAGAAVAGPTIVNPDAYASGTRIGNLFSSFTLTAQGSNAYVSSVSARDTSASITSSRVFGNKAKGAQGDVETELWEKNLQLRMEFNTPVSFVSIAAIGAAAGSVGRLEIYDANNVLLGRYTTQQLALGGIETMKIGRNSADIKYAIAYGHATTKVALDNLQVGAATTGITNAQGAYAFAYLPAGTYYVRADVPGNWESSNPTSGIRPAQVTSNAATAAINFAQHADYPLWQNQQNHYDVNSDSQVTPLDALLIIIDLNSLGPRTLSSPPPSGESSPTLIDVNGDGFATPLDALAIIIYLNSGSAGESPEPMMTAVGEGATSSPQAEAATPGESVGPASGLFFAGNTMDVSFDAAATLVAPTLYTHAPATVSSDALTSLVADPTGPLLVQDAWSSSWQPSSDTSDSTPFLLTALAKRRSAGIAWDGDDELWDLLAEDQAKQS